MSEKPNTTIAVIGIDSDRGLIGRGERRFYLGASCMRALRIEEAKQLIETESAGIDQVGFSVGYEDPTFFRRLFKRRAGLTPAAYRRKFTNILTVGK